MYIPYNILVFLVFLIEEEEVNLLRKLIYLEMNNVPVAKDTAQCIAYRPCT